jgi:hypothetical protein
MDANIDSELLGLFGRWTLATAQLNDHRRKPVGSGAGAAD